MAAVTGSERLGIRPLNARSLVLSVLLGLPEPRLPGRALIRLADLFGIAPGTMRTALSRMVGAGELAAIDGDFELQGRLLARKAAQDVGRRPAGDAWDGSWWVVTALAPSRALADRREFRAAMANSRMGELRPETWLRPANLPPPDPVNGTVAMRATLHNTDPGLLVARLWDLAAIRSRCDELLRALGDGAATVTSRRRGALRDATMLSAAIVRYLRAEPLLPRALTPPDWSVDTLRERYAEFDRTYGRVLRNALVDTPTDV